MATVTKENIGLLHEKLTLKLEKADYLPSFEKTLKDYSKRANIPGFRKGQVPAGLIRKMYGSSLFADEVLRSVDRALGNYLESDQLGIFGQPLPLDLDMRQLDVNNPGEYTFHFEIGMKPQFTLPDLGKAPVTRYRVEVTDEMVNSEVDRLQSRYGSVKEMEQVGSGENVLNVLFIETDTEGNEIPDGVKKENSVLVRYFTPEFQPRLMGLKPQDSVILRPNDAFLEKEREAVLADLEVADRAGGGDRYFKMLITRIAQVEKRELNEKFFQEVFPGVTTPHEFRERIRSEIQTYWDGRARNQIHDQIFHYLVDHTPIDLPETFLKKWLRTQGDGEKGAMKSEEQAEKDYPSFSSQLRWTLITDQVVREAGIQVTRDEVREHFRRQLMGYMGNALGDDQAWLNDYLEKMMRTPKHADEAVRRIETEKIFLWAESQVRPTDQTINAEEFSRILEAHQHHHH